METTAQRRSHDSAASQKALIDAARSLFAERGYQGATIRAIGERAGVDPAMIARYFVNKEGLYIATLNEDSEDNPILLAGLEPQTIVKVLFDGWDEPGRTPIARAMASPSLDPDVLSQVRSVVKKKLRDPLAEGLKKMGSTRADIESELLIATVLGICMVRANKTLPVLGDASDTEIHELLQRITAILA